MFKNYKETLSNNKFILLLSGSIFSNIGHSMSIITIVWMIYQKTNNPLLIALTFICIELPTILLGPFFGVLLDKYIISKLVSLANLTRAILFLFLALFTLNNLFTYFVFYILLFLSSSLVPISKSGENILVPKIVNKKNLITSNSLMNIQFDFAFIVGPIFGGIVATTSLGRLTFIIISIMFLLSSLIFLFIRYEQKIEVTSQPKNSLKNLSNNLLEGIIYIKDNPSIRSLIIISFLWNLLIWGTAPTLLPIFSEEHIGVGAEGFGILSATTSVGIIIGSFIVGFLKNNMNLVTLVFVSVGLHGLFYLLLALPMNLSVATIILIMGGIISAPAMIYQRTLIQQWVPENKQGRVFTLFSTMGTVGFPLGNIIIAFFISSLGKEYIYLPYLISGSIVFFSGIYFLIRLKEERHATSYTSVND